MKTLTLCLVFCVMACSQQKKDVPVIPDKDKVDYLIAQRGWLTVQKQYEDAFRKEPSVIAYEQAAQKLTNICNAAGAQLNTVEVKCAVPAPTSAPVDKPKENTPTK